MACVRCGDTKRLTDPRGVCFESEPGGERIPGTGCYGVEDAAEAARLQRMKAKLGTAEVTPEAIAENWERLTAEEQAPFVAFRADWPRAKASDLAVRAEAERKAQVALAAKVKP